MYDYELKIIYKNYNDKYTFVGKIIKITGILNLINMVDHKLQLFLEKVLLSKWENKIQFRSDMKLYQDFGLVGYDVDDFLKHFTKEFNVTLSSEFNFNERFYPETYSALNAVRSICIKTINIFLLKSIYEKELKDLSIEELEVAIKRGILL